MNEQVVYEQHMNIGKLLFFHYNGIPLRQLVLEDVNLTPIYIIPLKFSHYTSCWTPMNSSKSYCQPDNYMKNENSHQIFFPDK